MSNRSLIGRTEINGYVRRSNSSPLLPTDGRGKHEGQTRSTPLRTPHEGVDTLGETRRGSRADRPDGRTIRRLRRDEDAVTSAVAEAAESEAGELAIDLEEQSREFVQDLVSVLRERRQFVSGETHSEAEDIGDQSEPPPSGGRRTETTRNEGGYVVRFSDGKEIPEDGDETQTEQEQNTGSAVDYLIEEYDLFAGSKHRISPSRSKELLRQHRTGTSQR